MKKIAWIAAALGTAALLAVESPSADAAARRAERVKKDFPRGGPTEPAGRIEITRWPATKTRAERSRLVLRLKRLSVGQTYTLWADDPGEALLRFHGFAPYQVTPLRRKTTVLKYETGKAAFPFDASLEELGGQMLQVRDAAGNVVLAGSFPSFQ